MEGDARKPFARVPYLDSYRFSHNIKLGNPCAVLGRNDGVGGTRRGRVGSLACQTGDFGGLMLCF